MSRISADKNFFIDIIYAVHKVRTDSSQNKVKLCFIGDIQDEGIYYSMLRLINLLELNEVVDFTQKSITFKELPADIKSGYFINFSVGSFIGYSGIEAMSYGLKTIFYNIDSRYELVNKSSGHCFCDNISSLCKLIVSIAESKEKMDESIEKENKQISAKYILNELDKEKLLGILTN